MKNKDFLMKYCDLKPRVGHFYSQKHQKIGNLRISSVLQLPATINFVFLVIVFKENNEKLVFLFFF